MSHLLLRIEGEDGQVRLRDFVDILDRAKLILGDLDSAISQEPRGSLEWYIIGLKVGSAEAVIEGRPRIPSATERLGVMVNENFVAGLGAIEQGGLPPWFSEIDMKRVSYIAKRLGHPGAQTLVAAHLNGGERRAVITKEAGTNAKRLIAPKFKTIGSVVGKLELISVHGAPRFNVYDALTNRAVVCPFNRDDQETVTQALGKRVVVTGIVHRNVNGDPIRVEQPNVRTVDGEAPSIRDLIGIAPDITDGMTPVEYIRDLRDG